MYSVGSILYDICDLLFVIYPSLNVDSSSACPMYIPSMSYLFFNLFLLLGSVAVKTAIYTKMKD